MQDAGEDSAAQRETDGAHILKDYPCDCRPLGGKGSFRLNSRRLPERWTDRGGSRPDAMPAQQFCSNGAQQNLIGPDGISKTVMWKKYVDLEVKKCVV